MLTTAPLFRALALLLLLSAGPRLERQLAGFPSGGEAELAGSESCGRCHVEHSRRQKDHHMALTGRPVTAQNRDLWFSTGRLDKTLQWPSDAPPRYRLGGSGVVLEAAEGPGRLRRVEVGAVLGSGVRGFTPISAEDGKKIRELRLSFSSTHDSWLMTPGSKEDPDVLGTPKSVEKSRDCLECHATLLAWREDRLDPDASVFGVHCERCHGPGSAHLEAVAGSPQPERRGRAKREPAKPAKEDSESRERGGGASRTNRWSPDVKIFTPRSLRADQQVKFCGQCHRLPSDFEPLDILNRDPMLARHAGAGLMLSACFRRSPPEKTIRCVECHDPHRNIEPGKDDFKKTCLRCHASPERRHWSQPVTASSDCISCHMAVEEKAFHGVRFTDHWIRVPGPRAPLTSREQDEYLRYLEDSYREASLRPGLGSEKKAKFRVNLGEVLFGQNQLESAFGWLREGLSFSPSYAQRLRAASMFREAGKLDEAVEILEQAILAEPGFAEAYYQQGELHQQQGRLDAAARRYREALGVRADFAGAHNSLGSVLGSQGNLDDAMVHFRRALELKPDYAEAHNNLGLALRMTGRLDEALAESVETARLKPDWPPALNALARLFASHPKESLRDPAAAVRLADRAALLTRYDDPTILDTLAVACAAAGQFERAALVAEEAIRLAAAAQAEGLAQQIRARLELYRRREPYREPARQ